MSKRVYEIARDLDLSTKEVIGRLNDVGLEVKSHLEVIEDPILERAFGQDADDAAPNGHAEAQEAEVSPSRNQPRRERLPTRRVLAYILAGALALAVAAGVGATAAVLMRGDGGSSGSGESQLPNEQGNESRPQQKQGAPQKEAGASDEQSEAEYVARIGEIQANSVETFLDSHQRLMRYDALTADDVHKMQANQAALSGFAHQVEDLNPPQKYSEQYEVFRSAINELYEASKLAYALAADPTTATKSEFDEHDHQVDQAAADLERSNEMLDRHYKTIEGARMEEIGTF